MEKLLIVNISDYSTRPSAQDLSKKKEAIPAEPKEFRAIQDFDREYDDELSFKEGEVTKVVEF